MRFYACVTCATSYQVAGEVNELSSVWSMVEGQQEVSCPTPKCAGHLVRVRGPVRDPRFVHVDIPLPVFFRAINGFGGPDGAAASVSRFRELITTKKVIAVHADRIGAPERVILRRLVLEGGTILHFDTSSKGACCYYIEEPGPSCLEVVENELYSEGSDPNREEAGRAAEAHSSSGPTARDSGTSEASTVEHTQPGGMPPVSAAGELPEPGGASVGESRTGKNMRV